MKELRAIALLLVIMSAIVLLIMCTSMPRLHSPYWHTTHCGYIPLYIADNVPDGLYVNCK